VEGQRLGCGCSRPEGTCLTCDIEVGIARSFAQLVGDDTLVDAGMLRSHSREHQAMDIPVLCHAPVVAALDAVAIVEHPRFISTVSLKPPYPPFTGEEAVAER